MPETLEQKSGKITLLGYEDISEELRAGNLEEIRKYNVVRNIQIIRDRVEAHQGIPTTIYFFDSSELRAKGRIFPLDEVLKVGDYIDVIVQAWKNSREINLDTQPYHDFYQGERIPIRVSRMVPGQDPSFKLFNYIGCFIKDYGNHSEVYRKIKVGSEVLVEVNKVTQVRDKINVFTEPIKLL